MMRLSKTLVLAGLILGLGSTGCRIQDSAKSPTQVNADAAPAKASQAQSAQAPAPASKDKAVAMSAVASPEGEAPKLKPAILACATDSDCHAIPNYCGGCHCEVGNAKQERKCKDGEKVACFADPCMDKATRCNQGRCELVAKAPVQ